MSNWLSFVGLMAAILLAWRKSTPAVKLYFRAQAIYTVALFFGEHTFKGWHPYAYPVIYVMFTLPIIETCWFLIWEALPDEKALLWALTFGLGTGCIAVFGIPNFTRDTYIVFFEGVVLSVTGMAMLLVAPRLRTWAAVETIGTLSLALSLFDFVYVVNPNWDTANRWLPSLLGIAAFGSMALRQPKWEKTCQN